ncbi:MAG: hypothetical protein ACTSPV_08675 [Candidatus Hodarchaeales archaeon]
MRDKKQNFGNIQPSRLSGLGVLIALIWIFFSILQEKPETIILLGTLNFLLMTYVRVRARRKDQFESEGGIIGFLVTWVIVFWTYNKKEALFELLTTISVREFLVILLALSFFVWFIVTPKKTTQELVFGFPPFLSQFMLNLWKLAVVFLFLVNLEELKFLNELGVAFFIGIGFYDIILFYMRSFRINYVDIILNPLSLLNATFLSVLAESSKWVLLTLIFIILGQMTLDLWSFGLIFTAIALIIVSITTNVVKLSISSGVFEKQVEKGKKVIPKIFEEVVEISSSKEKLSKFNDFYEVVEPIKIEKKNEISVLEPGEFVIHFPFSHELENETGVFLLHFNLKNVPKKGKKTKTKTQKSKKISIKYGTRGYKNFEPDSDINLLVKRGSVHRIPFTRWESLRKDLRPLSRDEIATNIGITPEDLDKELAKVIKGSVIVQEQLRCRIRGLPAPSFSEKKRSTTKIEGNKLIIPEELLQDIHLKEDQEIELIKGKDEYLFYVKLKRKN